jgi:hypothetical protein
MKRLIGINILMNVVNDLAMAAELRRLSPLQVCFVLGFGYCLKTTRAQRTTEVFSFSQRNENNIIYVFFLIISRQTVIY